MTSCHSIDEQMSQKRDDQMSDEQLSHNLRKVKTRHPLGASCKLFHLHTWLYFLYIVGTLLII